jgi:hypothetical protein
MFGKWRYSVSRTVRIDRQGYAERKFWQTDGRRRWVVWLPVEGVLLQRRVDGPRRTPVPASERRGLLRRV